MYKARANKHRKAITFNPGDMVWLHLRKEMFQSRRKNKLIARGDDPFKILQKVNDNAYKLELPRDMGVSLTFNVCDLTPYLDDEENGDDLRVNHNQKGENHANSMSISVQESSQVLLSTQKFRDKGLGPCTDLEFQFKVYLKLLGSITLFFWEGQEPS